MSKLLRIGVIWLLESLFLLLFAALGLGLTVTNFRAAIFSVALIGLLNALVRPAIVKLTLPITAVTLGLFSLIVNGCILMLAARLLPGLSIDSLLSAIALSIGLAIFNTLVSYVLHIQDDDSYYYGVIKKAAKHASTATSSTPGFFYLEVDGLGYKVLQLALNGGYMPNLQAYLKTHRYHLVPWETDLSPQTPSCQAGILHGNNTNMPAFRWYDRQKGKLVTAGNPLDSAVIEKDHSNGKGLLAQDGYCVNNMFSGDAKDSTLTISTLKQKRTGRHQPLYYYFINPYNYAHTLAATVTEIFREWRDARYAKAHHIEPSISHRGVVFMLMRAVLNVYLSDISFAVAIGQVLSGRTHLYLTAAGYDDIAHHTGKQSPESLASLTRLDNHIGHLLRAITDAPRPYHLIFLSDHGQSDGPNFQKIYGYTIGDLINQTLGLDTPAAEIIDRDEAYTNTNKLLTEITRQLRPKKQKLVSVGKEAKEIDAVNRQTKREKPVIVMASGNLGLLYLTGSKQRATLEEISARHPQLIEALVNHPGISFVMVKTAHRGTVILGKKGTYFLKTDTFDGKNPLKIFNPSIVSHLKRHNTFPHMPDVLINSYFNPKTNEVYAFEDFVGSHGGIGGPQNEPFIAFPPSLSAPKNPLIGAAKVYRLLKSWQKGV